MQTAHPTATGSPWACQTLDFFHPSSKNCEFTDRKKISYGDLVTVNELGLLQKVLLHQPQCAAEDSAIIIILIKKIMFSYLVNAWRTHDTCQPINSSTLALCFRSLGCQWSGRLYLVIKDEDIIHTQMHRVTH